MRHVQDLYWWVDLTHPDISLTILQANEIFLVVSRRPMFRGGRNSPHGKHVD